MKLIDLDNIDSIELEDSVCHLRHIKGDEIDWSIESPIVNAVVVPKNATNVDVIRAMFPSLTIRKQDEYVNLFIGEPILKNVLASIDEVLWNSPYKESEE